MTGIFRTDNFKTPGRYQPGAFKSLPGHLQEDLMAELEAQKDACASLEGVPLYRAQGAAEALNQLIETLKSGTVARTPEVRTTSAVC